MPKWWNKVREAAGVTRDVGQGLGAAGVPVAGVVAMFAGLIAPRTKQIIADVSDPKNESAFLLHAEAIDRLSAAMKDSLMRETLRDQRIEILEGRLGLRAHKDPTVKPMVSSEAMRKES